MTLPSDEADAALESLAAHAPQLKTALDALRQQWAPSPPPPYIVIAKYVDILTQPSPLSLPLLDAVLQDIERYVSAGGPLADLAATGFLEALMRRADAGHYDFASIVLRLGPRSLAYCLAWDDFTGCTAVRDSLARARRGSI